MSIEFPKITRSIRLGEYAPEFGDAEIIVHVNVPRAMIQQIQQVNEWSDEQLYTWLGDVWQDISADEAKAIYAHCENNDPALWSWLMNRTVRLLFDYRAGSKKESPPLS